MASDAERPVNGGIKVHGFEVFVNLNLDVALTQEDGGEQHIVVIGYHQLDQLFAGLDAAMKAIEKAQGGEGQ